MFLGQAFFSSSSDQSLLIQKVFSKGLLFQDFPALNSYFQVCLFIVPSTCPERLLGHWSSVHVWLSSVWISSLWGQDHSNLAHCEFPVLDTWCSCSILCYWVNEHMNAWGDELRLGIISWRLLGAGNAWVKLNQEKRLGFSKPENR